MARGTSYKRQPHVYCPLCHEFHAVKGVTFIDIEEDMSGRDKLTFVCPETKEEAKGLVVLQ